MKVLCNVTKNILICNFYEAHVEQVPFILN